jgi:hypothetical protein
MYSLATFTAFDFTSRFHMQIDRKLVGDPCRVVSAHPPTCKFYSLQARASRLTTFGARN